MSFPFWDMRLLSLASLDTVPLCPALFALEVWTMWTGLELGERSGSGLAVGGTGGVVGVADTALFLLLILCKGKRIRQHPFIANLTILHIHVQSTTYRSVLEAVISLRPQLLQCGHPGLGGGSSGGGGSCRGCRGCSRSCSIIALPGSGPGLPAAAGRQSGPLPVHQRAAQSGLAPMCKR